MNELEKLDQLIKSTNRGGHFRCPICNSVSNESIETDIGDFKPGLSFTHDPKDSMHFICIDCSESINEILEEYEEDDDG